ncbi:MAG: hypothetical protein ORN28_03060, partial [Rhodoferax sp.]|nr:hypothetical protein [Rhodoferax sp.]
MYFGNCPCGLRGGGSSGGGGTDTPVAPSITTQPVNQSVNPGQSATFTVTATGAAPLAYQWLKNGKNIAGATFPTYTTPPTDDSYKGVIYSVSVSNSVATVTSSKATLTVLGAALGSPAISSQPAAQSVVAPGTASFSVTATGTEPFTYQWLKNGTPIDGATGSTYTTPATSNADIGTALAYSVIVANSAGSVTSSDAALTVTAAPVAPTITTQPKAQTVIAGQNSTFTVKATGTAPLRYQWKRNNNPIPNATGSSYTTPATRLAESGTKYSVDVINDLGTVPSEEGILTVTVAPVITTQPESQSVFTGLPANFSVAATGTEPFTYQWYRGDTMLEGETAPTYRIVATASGDNGAVFKVVVRNSAGQATSNPATLTLLPVRITTQPRATMVDHGQTASFSVTAEGSGILSYQWKKNDADIGTNSNTYTIPVADSADSGAVFTVVVTNSLGGTVTTTTSNPATLTVNRYSLVANASGGTYDKTECVKDLKTGLVWEGKPASGSHSLVTIFTHYDSTSSLQKDGISSPTQTEINASTNSMGYRNTVNTSPGLCGITTWRLPTKEEL